jgi:ribonuclease T2
MRRTLLVLMLSLAAFGGSAEARERPHKQAQSAQGDAPGQFDYYALALSWSPSYCATHRDPNQCDSGRKLGFVLHGLWPQYEKGYPASCSTEQLSAADKAKYGPMFPSPKLIGHEWPKHGTCSGLTAPAYFELTAKLKARVAIPAQFQQPAQPVRISTAGFIQAFRSANPSLEGDSVLPFCSGAGRFLQEIHACFEKAGGSRSCGAAEIKRSAKSCGQETFLVQSVR